MAHNDSGVDQGRGRSAYPDVVTIRTSAPDRDQQGRHWLSRWHTTIPESIRVGADRGYPDVFTIPTWRKSNSIFPRSVLIDAN